MVPRSPVSYGKNTQMVPRDLLARYSGTMQRIFCGRAAAAAAAAAVPHRSSSTSSYSYSCRLDDITRSRIREVNLTQPREAEACVALIVKERLCAANAQEERQACGEAVTQKQRVNPVLTTP